MKISINNVGGYKIPKKQINRLFKILSNNFFKYRYSEISIAFVDIKIIKKLNKKYRNKNTATDVLSFTGFDEKDKNSNKYFLGEILISYPVAKLQSQKQGHAINYEIIFLLVHGFLHLIGYDHLNKKDEQVMKRFEKTILNKFNNQHK